MWVIVTHVWQVNGETGSELQEINTDLVMRARPALGPGCDECGKTVLVLQDSSKVCIAEDLRGWTLKKADHE